MSARVDARLKGSLTRAGVAFGGADAAVCVSLLLTWAGWFLVRVGNCGWVGEGVAIPLTDVIFPFLSFPFLPFPSVGGVFVFTLKLCKRKLSSSRHAQQSKVFSLHAPSRVPCAVLRRRAGVSRLALAQLFAQVTQ